MIALRQEEVAGVKMVRGFCAIVNEADAQFMIVAPSQAHLERIFETIVKKAMDPSKTSAVMVACPVVVAKSNGSA